MSHLAASAPSTGDLCVMWETVKCWRPSDDYVQQQNLQPRLEMWLIGKKARRVQLKRRRPPLLCQNHVIEHARRGKKMSRHNRKPLEQQKSTLDQQPRQEVKVETLSRPRTSCRKPKPKKRHRDPSVSPPRVPGKKERFVQKKKVNESSERVTLFLIGCMHDS